MAASTTDTVRLGAQTDSGRNLRHGYAAASGKSSEYLSWRGAIARCYKPHDLNFPKYGARGISVCDRWRFGDGKLSGFQCFIADMGDKPSKMHSLDRVDNDGDYTPENCKWSTHQEQCNNRRSSRRESLYGETRTLAEWCHAHGQPINRVYARLKAGWSLYDALSTPQVKPGFSKERPF